MHRLDLGHFPSMATPLAHRSVTCQQQAICYRDTSPAPTCLAIAFVVPSMVPVDTSKFFSSLLMMSFLMFLGMIFFKEKKAPKGIRYFKQSNPHTEMWNIHAISMVVSMYVCIYIHTQYIAYVENCIPLYLRQKKNLRIKSSENNFCHQASVGYPGLQSAHSPWRQQLIQKIHPKITAIQPHPSNKKKIHSSQVKPSLYHFSIQFHLVSHFDIQIHDLIADGIKTALDVIRIFPTGLWHTWQHELLIQPIHCRQSIQTCFVQRRPSFQALVKYRSQTSPSQLLECSLRFWTFQYNNFYTSWASRRQSLVEFSLLSSSCLLAFCVFSFQLVSRFHCVSFSVFVFFSLSLQFS